jgi:cytochrome c6
LHDKNQQHEQIEGKRMNMKKIAVVMMGLAMAAGTMAYAEDGKALFSKCQGCHGANGAADSSMAKAMKVPAATDPAVKALSAAQMITITTDGKGKMPSYKGKLTDPEIKAVVDYYRTFVK